MLILCITFTKTNHVWYAHLLFFFVRPALTFFLFLLIFILFFLNSSQRDSLPQKVMKQIQTTYTYSYIHQFETLLRHVLDKRNVLTLLALHSKKLLLFLNIKEHIAAELTRFYLALFWKKKRRIRKKKKKNRREILIKEFNTSNVERGKRGKTPHIILHFFLSTTNWIRSFDIIWVHSFAIWTNKTKYVHLNIFIHPFSMHVSKAHRQENEQKKTRIQINTIYVTWNTFSLGNERKSCRAKYKS